MDFMVDIQIRPPVEKIGYQHNIMVVGSCFTEHIGGRLANLKFPVVQNPNGILFDPLSVCRSLASYIAAKQYKAEELIELNGLWQSWQHHSKYSGLNVQEVLDKINQSQQAAHKFLKQSDWLIITLGSAFFYRLAATGEPVANCHRAPAQSFIKHLTEIDEIITSMDGCIRQVFTFNPGLKIILTISPVRHIREGLVENNRSKSRLIEAVHQLVEKYESVYYFPAYELVIDVLRDYRFFDIDLVHPNYAATEFVYEKFVEYFIEKDASRLMVEIKDILNAYRHRPLHATSGAHTNFLKAYLKKTQQFQQKNPQFDFTQELKYFSRNAV
ncbi:MAG: GSCFA domain-containing protein [Chitinophagaceae bacterium]